jgi:hypothetical protein
MPPNESTPPREARAPQPTWLAGEVRIFQLGFFVDDLVSAAHRWARIHGIGPFHVLPRFEASGVYRGADSKLDMQIGIAQAGAVQIELIQQFCDRPSVYRDRFAKGESGFHQICTLTPDYDGRKRHYEALGYELASEMSGGGTRAAFYDTLRDFGFFTELTDATPHFLAYLTKIIDTCASWDGRDPVRLMTRDGYRTP